MREISDNLLKGQGSFPILVMFPLDHGLEVSGSNNVNAHINLVQAGIGSNLELQKVDSNERRMTEPHFHTNSFLQKVHFRRRVFRFIKNGRLAFPTPPDKSFLQDLVEVGSR